MPNSINRRRLSASADSSAEVAQLKEELENLRKLYIEDMTNVSNDMRSLNDQITQVVSPPAAADPVEGAPTETNTNSTEGPIP